MLITKEQDEKKVRKIFHKVAKAISKQTDKYKLLYIGCAKWTNEPTYREELVNGLYILGEQSSNKPILVTKIDMFDADNNMNEYVMNEYLTHTNISSEPTTKELLLCINGKAYRIVLTGQRFCNPLTSYHVLEGVDDDTRTLVKANLISQNFDDAYSTPCMMSNSSKDRMMERDITRRNSTIEMLTNTPGWELSNYDASKLMTLTETLRNLDKESIMAKKKEDTTYKKIPKAYYREFREAFSDYYPAYTKEMVDKLNIEIPKEQYDIGIYGLGSAGTAILDQVCRSNWIKTIYLCDFDNVEAKNINNQWYTKEDAGLEKTYASYNKIRNFNRTIGDNRIEFTIKYDSKKFEETDYKNKVFKYVVSGFDSIKVRQAFFKEIKSGNIETQYLIDCRYLDLAGSVYIVDTSNKEEMNFYEANLNADAELLNEKEENEKEKTKKIKSIEELKDWLKNRRAFIDNCGFIKRNYFQGDVECGGTCGDEECIKCYYEAYKKYYPVKGIDFDEEEPLERENTCVKFNYIDIYKYVGAIVFGAMRRIQNNLTKPFTLIEAQTDVNGLPGYMLVKE